MAVLFCLSLVSCSKESLDSEQSSVEASSVLLAVDSKVPVTVTVFNGTYSSNITFDKRYSGGDRVHYYYRSDDFIKCTSIKFKSDVDMDGDAFIYYSFLGADLGSKLIKNFDGKEYTLNLPSNTTCVEVEICAADEARSSIDGSICFNMSADTLKRENVTLKF